MSDVQGQRPPLVEAHLTQNWGRAASLLFPTPYLLFRFAFLYNEFQNEFGRKKRVYANALYRFFTASPFQFIPNHNR